MDLPDKTNPQKKKVVKPLVESSQEVKRPATRRFFDYVFAESPKDLIKKVARDVLVPRAKAGFEEAFNNFLGGMLWGDPTNRPMSHMVRGTVIRGGSVNYAAISSNPASQARLALPHSSSAGNYRDLVFPTVQDAEIVLGGMYDLLNEYRVVAVGDLMEMSNRPVAISDNSYGWTSLDGARISKVASGYVLELPRPTLI